jgi:hypothetical protein
MIKKIIAVAAGEYLSGEIEILNETDRKVYVVWRVYDQKNKIIASLTNNYFLGDNRETHQEIFELVRKQMEKYRVRRKKLFTTIEFDT